jgi:hypothetical protein
MNVRHLATSVGHSFKFSLNYVDNFGIMLLLGLGSTGSRGIQPQISLIAHP